MGWEEVMMGRGLVNNALADRGAVVVPAGGDGSDDSDNDDNNRRPPAAGDA